MESNSLSAYIKQKEFIKYQLYYEQALLLDKLQTKPVLSNLEGALLGMEASKLVDNNIRSFNLSADAKIEVITNYIKHDLAQLHQNTPKAILIEVTNAALINSEQVINEHNKQRQIHEIANHTNNEDAMKTYSLTQADLPILALSLASNILNNYHNSPKISQNIDSNLNFSIHNTQDYVDYSNTFSYSQDQQHQIHQVHLQQSINMAKNSFKFRIEQDSMKFEQHQQQVMQRQMSQHQGLEM